YGEYGVVYFNDYIYSSCGAGFGFYCYGLDGTYYGNFSVSGGPSIMDMCSDGTYVYGSPANGMLYEMYFSGASGILISTYSIPVRTRAIAYDNEYDGFWANNWSSDITLYDRAGCILNSFPCTTHRSFSGFARLNDDGNKWLYGFSHHGGVSPSVIVQIDPHSGQETGITFDAIVYGSWPHIYSGGLDAFDTYSPGSWTLLGSIQSHTIFGVNGGIAEHPINFDLKLTEIIEPNTSLDLSVENIVIDLKNCGAITQSNFEVRYRVNGSLWILEVCPGPLAMGESMEYTFTVPHDFSGYDTYYIEAEVLLPGDEYPNNNCGDKTIENKDATLYCNYSIEMWDDDGDGWNGGFVQIFDNGVECFSGYMSPCFGPETFEFFAINNSFLSSVFTPGGWAHDCSYNIYDHEGNLIFEDGYGEEEPTGGDIGYFFCITPDFDACINEIILPDNGINLGEELVTVTILNNGMLEFSDFQVGFSVDSGAMIMETVVGPLSPGNSIEYTFTEFADLSAAGSHTIEACTFLDSDEYRDNDCLLRNIHNLIQTGNQTINFSMGFQFVSSRVIPIEPDMEIVAQEIITDDLYYIRNSQGYMLRKIGPVWVNGIGDWSTNEGYLIKTSEAGQFTIEGNILPSSTPIYVLAGFQFVSYLPLYEIDALEAFNSIISDSLIYIRNSDGEMIKKIGPNWINSIGNCIPGEAYLFKTLSDDTLIYPFKCGKPFTDLRDGQAYNTVQIGDQCWMAENLNIGERISSSMNQTNNGVIEKYCINNPGNCDEYGGFYQWNEMMEYSTIAGSQGICPNGWHVPTYDEWTILYSYLGGYEVAGGKMKESGTLHWLPPNTGATNESG
ncbi:MAG: hypothetical protein K8S00_07525, partial [Bacteroidales bacterium]|nr:hypothetical protein [Bacteroidales bacterium]